MKSTERFTTRVENYVRYRPSYPDAVLSLLQRECGLGEGSVVADVGSGTGISTQFLLRSGATVLGIEPNAEMRAAAEDVLRDEPRFRSVDAMAEATSLADASVDLIVAGQSFHWFDQDKARTEFRRILRPGRWVVLMWNERLTSGTAFLKGYEEILHAYSPDYQEVQHRYPEHSPISNFFEGEMRQSTFENKQVLDFESLKGRVLSSSYAPELGQVGHDEMITALAQLFEETAENGTVDFLYETQVYFGHL